MLQVLLFKTGKTTCSELPAKPGSLCRFAGPEFDKFKCQLFGVKLDVVDGWLQRCPDCLNRFKGVEEI